MATLFRGKFTMSSARHAPSLAVPFATNTNDSRRNDAAAAPPIPGSAAAIGLDAQRRAQQLAQGRKELERYHRQRLGGHIMKLQREVDEVSEQDRKIMALALVEEAARYNWRMAQKSADAAGAHVDPAALPSSHDHPETAVTETAAALGPTETAGCEDGIPAAIGSADLSSFARRWTELKFDVLATDTEEVVDALSHMALFEPLPHASLSASVARARRTEVESIVYPGTPLAVASSSAFPTVAATGPAAAAAGGGSTTNFTPRMSLAEAMDPYLAKLKARKSAERRLARLISGAPPALPSRTSSPQQATPRSTSPAQSAEC